MRPAPFRATAVIVASLATAIAAALLGAIAPGGATQAAATRSPAGYPPCLVTNLTDAAHLSYFTLAAAVATASAGDMLQVKGTCHGTATIDKNLTLIGKTTAESGTPILDGEGLDRVLDIAVGKRVTIRTLTLRNGVAPDPADDTAGGVIRNRGTLRLIGVTVTDGSATRGGGIVSTGSLTLTDSTVSGNTALAGGGIWSTGPVRLQGTTQITENQATGQAGGIQSSARVTLLGTASVHHNTSDGDAGGIRITGAPLTLADQATVRANTAAAAGGGVHATDATVTLLERSAIKNNGALEAGGAWVERGVLALAGRSAISGNRAERHAGAIALESAVILTGASTIRANRASLQGAGILVVGSMVMRDASTVRENVDDPAGGDGAIVLKGQEGVAVSLRMRDDSRVTGHAFGEGWAAVVVFTGCATVPTLSGVAARAVGNTPADIARVEACGFP